jgi:transcriptional regulator with XRE-family HTH domain
MARSNARESLATMYDFSVLRELRKREDLTIAQVCERSGLSPAVLSRLERNQAQAELATLYRLARVFSINAADLLSLAERRSSHRKHQTTHVSGGIRFTEVAYNNVRCLFGKGTRGMRLSRPEVHRDDYEVCWVIRGEVEVTLPGEKQRLSAGEALQFDAMLEHGYDVRADCDMVILHLPKAKRF